MPPNECVSSHFIRDLTVYKHIYIYIYVYTYISIVIINVYN